MTQGLFRLSQLFQQRRQFTPCQDIVGTDRQGILKPTDSCDPFLVRHMVCACWWFHRAFRCQYHARSLVLFGLLPHVSISNRLVMTPIGAVHGKCHRTNERLGGLVGDENRGLTI